MKKDKKVAPLIVDGELYSAKRYRNKISKKNTKEDKLPTKRFTIVDIILTLIGVLMVGYGIYGLVNKPDTSKEVKKEEKKTEEKINFDYSKYVVLNIDEYSIYTDEDINNMNSGLSTKDMSNSAKLYLASRLCTKVEEDGITYIKEDDLDNGFKKIFGNITYTKETFIGYNQNYTYDKDNHRYIITPSDIISLSSNKKYNHIEREIKDNKLIYREYVAFTDYDGLRSYTLGNVKLDEAVNNNIFLEDLKKLKYYEYEFIKKDNSYILNKITIK